MDRGPLSAVGRNPVLVTFKLVTAITSESTGLSRQCVQPEPVPAMTTRSLPAFPAPRRSWSLRLRRPLEKPEVALERRVLPVEPTPLSAEEDLLRRLREAGL
jgi:hypothetical protein